MQFEKLSKLDTVADQKTLLGYFPCLTQKFGQIVESPPIEYLQDFESDQGNIQAVGWQELITKEIVPVLFIKNAKDICQHLKDWMNGDSSWFTFVWETNHENRYSIALIPDSKRMIENSGLENIHNTNIFHWVWSFNSANPFPDAKKYLKHKGQQKIVIADFKNHSFQKTFIFPVFKQSEISVLNPLLNQCWTHLFKN